MRPGDLALMIHELKPGGPTPFVPDQDEPFPVNFNNEMLMLTGETACSVLIKGRNSYRTINLIPGYSLLRRRGVDLCLYEIRRSYIYAV
ncbi:MAG: hypothetical protein GTO18_16845 [Anaerolineales bacterium]|nr:hypothetical protein [Anaerolineales bacterium]